MFHKVMKNFAQKTTILYKVTNFFAQVESMRRLFRYSGEYAALISLKRRVCGAYFAKVESMRRLFC